jgi:hypothetical protein
MVGYFYHMDYLHDNKTVIKVPDSPPPKKKARVSAPVKRTRSSGPVPPPTQDADAAPSGPKVFSRCSSCFHETTLF